MRSLPLRRANIIDEIARRSVSRRFLQRRVAQAGLGILQALRASNMSIEDAENDLFNLDTYQAARRRRLHSDLIEFLEWGMELQDVVRLVPGGLGDSYRSMEELLLNVISKSLGRSTRRRKQPSRRSAS